MTKAAANDKAAAPPRGTAASDKAAAPPPPAAAPEPKHPRVSPQAPDLAKMDAAAPAGAAMAQVMPYIESALTKCFGTPGFEQFEKEAAPHTIQPLDIKESGKDKMTSYKEPWKNDKCATALLTTAMYEAGPTCCG